MILGILVEQGSEWTDIATFVISLITAIIALLALFVWRAEKLHDIRIEALAKSRRAYNLIYHLRSPVSSIAEIDDKLLNNWKSKNGDKKLTPAEASYLIYHSKLDRYRETYKEVEILREKLWANYEDNNPFLQFYNFVLDTIGEVGHAHHSLLILSDYEIYTRNEFNEERINARKITYTLTGDKISVRLDELYEGVKNERNKASWFLLSSKI